MIRVLLFSSEPILEAGLMYMLEKQANIQLLGMIDQCGQLENHCRKDAPDLILVSVEPATTMLSILSAIRQVTLKWPNPSKLVLWSHTLPTEMISQAMSFGYRGLLRKALGRDLIIKCIEKVVMQNEFWYEKSITDALLLQRRVSLTPREGELVQLLSRGMKNKEIAAETGLTDGSIKVYMSRLFRKFGVKDRFELALYTSHNLSVGKVNDPVFQHLPVLGFNELELKLRSLFIPKKAMAGVQHT